VRILLKAASLVNGSLRCGLSARDMLTAWILVAYETGLRPGDIMMLKSTDIEGNVIRIVQRKTGNVHCCSITNSTSVALSRLCTPKRQYLFGLPKSTRRKWELLLFQIAENLGLTRKYRQGLGTLRKTHATEVCRISDANAAALSLGHVSGSEIARKHYIQPDAMGLPKSPPKIGWHNEKKRTGKGKRNH
jgi:integrase